ncbi:MAG: ABC transporter ATP-binding protein [Clostridiaceae bacterium]|nr:ABC transporter ATP-binding protein [Clostridiaceae bacterium]
MSQLLNVENLSVSFMSYAGEVKAVRNVSFTVGERETLALVGESGCGKTVTSKSIMRLLSRTSGVIKEGSKIAYKGEDILRMDKKRLNEIRGSEISMIFQDSMTSLNPTMTIGNQITENILTHSSSTKSDARKRAEELLSLVEIPAAHDRLKNYPHQLSGGMRQRVMIAIALAMNPTLLIADEPTTALDVTIQAQLLDLLRSLKEQFGMSVILVTHDLGIVSDFADKVQVMYAGTIVERGTVSEIFQNPRHPYTWALLNSIPGMALKQKSKLYSLKGTPPDLILPLEHCPFAARCEYCMPICKKQKPEETALSDTHGACCWLLHPNAPKVLSPRETGGITDEQ